MQDLLFSERKASKSNLETPLIKFNMGVPKRPTAQKCIIIGTCIIATGTGNKTKTVSG
jgi:hypothetical protein